MKKLKISRLTPDSRYLQTVALKGFSFLACPITFQVNKYIEYKGR